MENVGNRILSVNVLEDISSEPVSTADVKSYANITYSDYDVLIDTSILAARQLLENISGKKFGEATIELQFTHSGCRPIKLPWGWFGKIKTVFYRYCRLVDWEAIAADDPRFEIENGAFLSDQGHWKITYTTEDRELPESILTAIKAQAKFMWENRNNDQMRGMVDTIARSLIQPIMAGENLL